MTNRYFIELALQVAKGSKCKKKKVGAVIIDEYKRIVSTGYNGSPRTVNNDCEDSESITYETTLHAEINALLFSRRSLENCAIYTTLSPCLHCAACILQAGIKKVYYLNDYRDLSGVDFLRSHNVKVIKFYFK